MSRYLFRGIANAAFAVIWGLISLAAAAAATHPIKTMSFNIRFDSGAPSAAANAWVARAGTNRRDLAVTTIGNYSPDILGVQEALANQVSDLQAALPDYDFYGVGRDNGDTAGEYSGIFYRSDRFTRSDQGTFWLSRTPDEPSFFPGTCCRRIASWVILQDTQAGDPEAGGQEYFVLNTHWDHQIQAARQHSAQLIRQRIDSLSGDRPLIVTGDMNATEINDAYLDLIGTNDPSGFQLLDSYREVVPERGRQEATFHGFSGGTLGPRIDYVLHDDFFSVDDASIDRARFNGSWPSDHYPVTATLRPTPVPEPSTAIALLVGVMALFMVDRRLR